MTEAEFQARLTKVLDQSSAAVSQTIGSLLAKIPEKALRLDLEIFPAQDGDGFFTVSASLDGPDLYVLQQAIAAHRAIFDVRYTKTGVEPSIPIVDPFHVDFCVNDIVVDCAARWLETIWKSLGDVRSPVPVMIIGHDDYGTITPIELSGMMSP